MGQPMKANPGGQLSPSEVVGRDKQIKKIWKILSKQSVIIYSERRIGKTCMIKKMEAEPQNGFVSIYFDLEKAGSCVEFFDLVQKSISSLFSNATKMMNLLKRPFKYLGGAEIGCEDFSIKLPQTGAPNWKTSTSEAFRRLDSQIDFTLVLFFDELPTMTDAIRKREGSIAAMELLDTLRSIRQETKNIRMVYTGSIGLHHVMKELRKTGYNNPSVNDMYKIDVPPLDFDDAVFLAKELILGEEIETKDIMAAANASVTEADRIPFYIQHIMAKAAFDGIALSESSIKKMVSSALTDRSDIWDMKHYLDRIDAYYSEDDKKLVIAVLDAVAGSETPLRFDEIFNSVKSSIITEDRDGMLALMDLILSDHYLLKDEQGMYTFAFGIIKRWWKTYRELG